MYKIIDNEKKEYGTFETYQKALLALEKLNHSNVKVLFEIIEIEEIEEFEEDCNCEEEYLVAVDSGLKKCENCGSLHGHFLG